jgi:hypothetical protein
MNLSRTGFSLSLFVKFSSPKPNRLKPVLLARQKGAAR